MHHLPNRHVPRLDRSRELEGAQAPQFGDIRIGAVGLGDGDHGIPPPLRFWPPHGVAAAARRRPTANAASSSRTPPAKVLDVRHRVTIHSDADVEGAGI